MAYTQFNILLSHFMHCTLRTHARQIASAATAPDHHTHHARALRLVEQMVKVRARGMCQPATPRGRLIIIK